MAIVSIWEDTTYSFGSRVLIRDFQGEEYILTFRPTSHAADTNMAARLYFDNGVPFSQMIMRVPATREEVMKHIERYERKRISEVIELIHS